MIRKFDLKTPGREDENEESDSLSNLEEGYLANEILLRFLGGNDE